MPVTSRRRRENEEGKPYKIVDLEEGDIVAQTDTLESANLFVRIYNSKEIERLKRAEKCDGLIAMVRKHVGGK